MQLQEMLGGAEKDFSAFDRNALLVEKAIDDRAGEDRGRKGVGQQTDLSTRLRTRANAKGASNGLEASSSQAMASGSAYRVSRPSHVQAISQ